MNLFLIKKDEDFNLICKIFIKILMLLLKLFNSTTLVRNHQEILIFLKNK
jgi:hypothetical protein